MMAVCYGVSGGITDEKKKGYTTSRSFVIHDQGIPKELIEYQMTCYKDHGTVLLRVYHENSVHAEELAEDLQTSIRKLHAGLKRKQKARPLQLYKTEILNIYKKKNIQNIFLANS